MAYEEESKMLNLHVCDTGMGIEPSNLGKLF